MRQVVEEHRRSVGLRLRELRKAQGLSQEDAAYKVGVTVKTWGDWERGKRDPYDTNWRKIGEEFDVDPGEIRGAPPSPLGLGAGPADDSLEARVVSMEERLAGLIEQQNGLLARQSGILEEIRAEQAELRRLIVTQESAAERLESAAELIRAARLIPPEPEEAPTPSRRVRR